MTKKFQDIFINLVKSIDFIGIKPSLFIEGSRRFNTLMGGVLCLLISAGIFCAFLFFSQDIIFRQYPNETNETQVSQYPKAIQISQLEDQDLGIVLQVVDESKSLVLNDYFKIQLSVQTVAKCISFINSESDNSIYISELADVETAESIRNSICKDNSILQNKYGIKTKTIDVEAINCDNSSISYLYPELNLEQKQQSLCIPKDQGVQLLGNSFFNIHQTFKIVVTYCQSIVCPKDFEELISDNSQIELKLFYKNFNYNLKSYSPLLYRPDKVIVPFTKSIIRNTKIELKNMIIETDIGLIFEDFRSESFVIISAISQSFVPLNDAKGKIIIEFTGSPLTSTIYRKYIKVQRILADVGGLFKTFVVVAIILNYFHNRAKYYEALFNKLFNIHDLGKYFQYYDPSLKLPYNKIKNSIFLASSDHDKFMKAAKINSQELLTKSTKQSKSYMDTINNYRSTTKETKTSLINVNYNNFNRKRQSMSEHSDLGIKKGEENKVGELLNNVRVANQESSSVQINQTSKISISLNSKEPIREETKNDIQKELVNQENSQTQQNDIAHVEEKQNDDDVQEYNEAVNFYIDNIKRDPKAKENYEQCKKHTFSFTAWELVQFICCVKSDEMFKKKSLLYGGKEMIEERMDLVNLMKKNLEFERFKNLILSKSQLLLLDSLSKFMLDPERLKLTDINNCAYEKYIDKYAEVFKSESPVDETLAKWVRTKYQLKF